MRVCVRVRVCASGRVGNALCAPKMPPPLSDFAGVLGRLKRLRFAPRALRAAPAVLLTRPSMRRREGLRRFRQKGASLPGPPRFTCRSGGSSLEIGTLVRLGSAAAGVGARVREGARTRGGERGRARGRGDGNRNLGSLFVAVADLDAVSTWA